MNNISEQLLQAMDIITEEKLRQLKYDKTVQATVYSIVDVDTGEYKVRYNGNIFSAFSEDTSKNYSIKDSVYVKVPEGNFSNKKIITSLVTSKSLSDLQLSDLANSIFEVSPSFEALYEYDPSQSYGVIAGASVEESGSSAYIFQNGEENSLFQQYSNNYEYIRLKASFLTQFHNMHNKGNYGIEVEFHTKEKDGSVKYRLDLQNFNGNPYGFSVYSPQQIILKAQKNYLTGLKSIKLFQEDFTYDKIVKNGVVTDEENRTVPNIFVKDISIQYVELQDLSNTTYYLTISAPKGIAFTNKVSTLDLVGRLIYNNEDIMDSKKSACQWYERDLSVMVGDENYSKSAGFGWKPLKGKTSHILSLDATEVLHQQRYKLVVAYNDDITLTAEITVWNHNASYDYSIVQTTDGAKIKLQLKNNLNDEVLLGDWYLSYPDGSYNSVENGKNQSEIIASPYLQYSAITFYCAVRNSEGDFIGTLEHTITNSENEEDVTISYIGEDSFRYDANGDISIEDAEKERTLQVNLAWKEGFGAAYSVSWLVKDSNNIEHEIPDSKKSAYSPENSMLENLWVDNYNILHYNIKQKYKVNFNNNTVIVKIRTIAESVYLFSKEILCLKDGDQGTNGTTYIAAIRPCNKDGDKLSGLQPLRYNNDWVEDIRARCYVYKDGELINGNSKYSISYKWQGTNVEIDNREGINDQVIVRGIPAVSAGTSNAELAFYVQIQVTINDNNKSIDIYASYPIDVIVGSTPISSISIDTIPSYIKYNSSGLTPSFYSNDINFYYDNKAYNDNITSLNTNILNIKTSDGKKYLEPASSFIFENIKENDQSNIGVLNLAIPDSTDRLIHPIIMYLDTYGNEAINGWDGTALYTGSEKDGEKQYIFAPQVGAGTKDSQNRFTGVVMGKDSGQKKVGLYGYQAGVNTFGLMEDGKAFFGASGGGGRIEIDGNTGVIEGGGGGKSKIGMTITLANLTADDKTPAIKLGTGAFQVNYDGSLIATKGKIGGTSQSSNDGWIIETHRLYSGSGKTHVELNNNQKEEFAIWAGSAGSATAKEQFFAVSKKGELYAKEGNIGGWKMTSRALTSQDNRIGLSSSIGNAFWAGADSGIPGNTPQFSGGSYFNVTSSGELTCTDAVISGDITATTLSCSNGEIGGWTINGTILKGGQTILNSNGTITCADLQCTGGKIGGWIISSDKFSSQGDEVKLISDGNIHVGNGRIGTILGSTGYETTFNFGLEQEGDDGIIIKSHNGNIALRTTGNGNIYLNGNELRTDISAENQHGFYARFA